MYKRLCGKNGIPNLVSYGHTKELNFIVLELLGPSIAQLFKNFETFSLSTVCKLGIQILNGLEALHHQRVVHCDLKPENVAVGCMDPTKIYLFDFGLSKIMPDDLQSPIQTNKMTGSLMFMSDGAHNGIVSYRNDIESLGYLLAYWKKGKLPWDFDFLNLEPKDTPMIALNKAHQLKLTKSGELLDSLPPQIAGILKASNEMTHTEKPNFSKLMEILLFDLVEVRKFDWEDDEEEKENVSTA